MDVHELIRHAECEWLDVKQEYHENNAKLLHDILCLANAYADGDRYLIFGVRDDGTLHGVVDDQRRKTSANLQDFLRQVPLTRIPTCQIETHAFEGLEIDVLTIRNRPDKPFLLTRDFERHGERVRNGVVYTRIGDTNIPLGESAPGDHVELMWRERFGFGLSPLQRAERYLDEPEKWRKVDGDAYLYYVDFPEFTIVDGETTSEKFVEEWTELYPDKSARSFEVEIRYHTTLLERFNFVACDGGRYRIPLPTPVRDGASGRKYVISKSGTPWKLAQIYQQYYPLEDSYALPGVELVE